MNTVNASEFAKTHIRWIWVGPEDGEERATAREAIDALFLLTDGWLDIVAFEVRLGISRRETAFEASVKPRDPYHLLRRDSALDVRIDPSYRPIETRMSILDAATAGAWLDGKLDEIGTDNIQYEPSLQELMVAGSRVRLPFADSSASLRVSCYAGELEIPIEHGWVTAPKTPPGIPSPVTIRIANIYGALRLVLEVFWSPWASNPDPPDPIRAGLARLKERGWHVDE